MAVSAFKSNTRRQPLSKSPSFNNGNGPPSAHSSPPREDKYPVMSSSTNAPADENNEDAASSCSSSGGSKKGGGGAVYRRSRSMCRFSQPKNAVNIGGGGAGGNSSVHSLCDSPTHSNSLRSESRLRIDSPKSARLLYSHFSEGRMGWNIKEDTSETDSSQSSPRVICNGSSPRRQDLDNKRSVRLLNADSRLAMDSLESPVEEKIIRAVHAQRKPLQQSEMISNDAAPSDLRSMIRAEVWHAMTDMKNSLVDQYSGKSWATESLGELENEEGTSNGDKSQSESDEGVIKTLTEMCKEYAAKLGESEKKVQALEMQLAAEQQRSLHMENSIRDYLPAAAIFSIIKPSQEEEEEEEEEEEKENIDNIAPPQALNREKLKPYLGQNFGPAKALKAKEIIAEPGCPLSRDGLFLPWLQMEEQEEEEEEEETNHHDHHLDRELKMGTLIDVQSQKKQRCSDERKEWGLYTLLCRNINENSVFTMTDRVLIGRSHFQNRIKSGQFVLCMGGESGPLIF